MIVDPMAVALVVIIGATTPDGERANMLDPWKRQRLSSWAYSDAGDAIANLDASTAIWDAPIQSPKNSQTCLVGSWIEPTRAASTSLVRSSMEADGVALLAGKTVLVTGASAGIGRAAAIGAARHGADVAINFARDEDGAP